MLLASKTVMAVSLVGEGGGGMHIEPISIHFDVNNIYIQGELITSAFVWVMS